MFYKMDEHYNSLMNWELENKFLWGLIKMFLLRLLLAGLFISLMVVGLLMMFFVFIENEERTNQLLVALVAIFVGILITSAFTDRDPLKNLSQSDQLFVSIYWLKNKSPKVIFYDYCYLLPLLNYIGSRLSKMHGSLNDLFIFHDILLNQKNNDLLQGIRSVFQKKMLFKDGQLKSDVNIFLDTLIDLYSYVVSAKRLRIHETLNPEQIKQISEKQAQAYINLSHIIAELLKVEKQEPNLLKIISDILEHYRRPAIWLAIVGLAGLFWFSVKDLKIVAIGLLPALIGFLFQKLYEK